MHSGDWPAHTRTQSTVLAEPVRRLCRRCSTRGRGHTGGRHGNLPPKDLAFDGFHVRHNERARERRHCKCCQVPRVHREAGQHRALADRVAAADGAAAGVDKHQRRRFNERNERVGRRSAPRQVQDRAARRALATGRQRARRARPGGVHPPEGEVPVRIAAGEARRGWLLAGTATGEWAPGEVRDRALRLRQCRDCAQRCCLHAPALRLSMPLRRRWNR